MSSFYEREFAEHLTVARATSEQLVAPFGKVVAACVEAIRAQRKIFFFGNGGSAADAQHLATELTIRYKKDRAPIAAIALTTDSSALTAAGNDMGFEHVFARPLAALGQRGDVAIGITTSGRSPNIIEAFRVARRLGITTIAFTGGTGGDILALSDHALVVPSTVTARIQEMHITLGQMLCGALEIELGLVQG
jgi:D-sedoheptulose 7-phosphate isomerase